MSILKSIRNRVGNAIIGKQEERAITRSDSWTDALFQPTTSSGETVSADTALGLAAVYSCVKILSETIASLPTKVYRITPTGKEEDINSPVWRLLHNQTNKAMSAYTFKEYSMSCCLLYGNSYAYIERNSAGVPISIIPLDPVNMQVAQTKDGEIFYKWLGSYDYDRQQIKAQIFDSSEIFHIMATTFDGVIGYSPIYALKETIGTGMAAERYSGSFFANGSRPSGVLQHAGRLDADAAERLRTSWNALYQGTATGNAARTAILEDGLEWKPISLPPDEAQFLQTMQASTDQIAAAFRVPTHFLGNREGLSQYNSLEAQASEFSRYTLTPWLTKFELESERKLLKENDRREIKFDLSSLLRSDHKTRFDIYRVGREIGVYSINEIRRLESMPPIKNGDDHIMPMNYEEVDKTGESEEISARSILTPIFTDSYSRLSKVLVNEVTRKINKNKDKKETRAISSDWVEKFFNERFDGIIKDTLLPVANSTSRCLKISQDDIYKYLSDGFLNMRSTILNIVEAKNLEGVPQIAAEINTRAVDELAELIRKGQDVEN
tara:strand:+ start:824 stop:2479 length:1656 start_codon:yes stop_codon:yes gene_type:complete